MTIKGLLPDQYTNHLEEKSNQILLQSNTKHSNGINLEHIISRKYKNIRFFYSNQDSKTIIKKEKAIIVINNKLSIKEQRQQLGEEFCHVLLHCGNQIEYQNSIILDKQESQAKRMSAYLLCPMFMFKQLNFMQDTYLLNEELADYFNVTNDFMRYRLSLMFGQDLNTITYHKEEFYGYIPIE